MKATWYVERYRTVMAASNDPMDGEADIAAHMILESVDLMEKRKAKTNDAIYAVFRELSQKWEAIRRQIPTLREDGFMEALKATHPNMHQALIRYRDWKTRR